MVCYKSIKNDERIHVLDFPCQTDSRRQFYSSLLVIQYVLYVWKLLIAGMANSWFKS